MLIKNIGCFLALVLLLPACNEVNAMSKMCLFSEVKGQVLSQGKPISGALIERSFEWAWKGEKGQDTTTTAGDGSFSLPAIFRSSLLGSVLPHAAFIDQSILIRHQGRTFEAWLSNKINYQENGELDGRPISLVCRLEAKPDNKDKFFGICELR
jgi:hypothetical protein